MSHSFSAASNPFSQELDEKFTDVQRDQETENLRGEVKDLQEKLETLRLKRMQDKDKLKEAEKTKIQLQQLLEFKSRIMESQAELQKEVLKARQEAKDAIEARERHADDMAEFTEAVEMATLDKEMAEEKCESVQAELEQMKERVEELTLDLEILRNEMSGQDKSGGASSYEVKQLEQQNERLKEALVKMRDLLAHEKHEQQRLHKEIDQQKSEIAELSRTKEKLSSQLDEYERMTADLKEQVDAALGAEEMVEQLTERNLTLEERVVELQESVNDLEALHDMNEELQENARDTELELREEVDIGHASIREAQRKVDALHETIADYEQTIQKFRELAESLKNRNQDLTVQLEKATNMAVSVPAEMFDFKVKFAETRAHAKAVEMELRRIEVLQANQHIAYLRTFMPDAFLSRGGDHDVILLLLLLPRIGWKTEILHTQIREKWPAPEEITKDALLKSHAIEQYGFGCRMAHLLLSLQTLLHQCSSALSACGVDVFLQTGTLFPEMAVQEKAIDFYIELLRKDQLDENVPLDAMEKTLQYFTSVYGQRLSEERVECTALLSDTAKQLSKACESIGTELARLQVLMQPGNENGDMTHLLTDLLSANEAILQSSKRIRRRMPKEGAISPVTFGKEIQAKLFASNLEVGRVVRTLWEITHSSTIIDPQIGFSNQKLKESAHMATDKVYGKDDSGPLECLRHSLDYAKNEVAKVAAAMQDGEYDFDGTDEIKPKAPLLLRAQAMKAEVMDVDNLKLKLEAKESDIIEFKKALKMKMDEFSELHIRKDMVEKKLEVLSKEQDDRLEKLQRKLDETTLLLRKKEKEFEETMDHLQADIDALESERGELKEKVKAMSKKALIESLTKSASLSSPASPTQSSPSAKSFVSGRESALLIQQIGDLRFALQHFQDENARLRCRLVEKSLAHLPKLKPCKKPTGLQSHTGCVDVSNTAEADPRVGENLTIAYRRSTDLLNDIWKFAVGMQVVDITKRRPGSECLLDSTMPGNQLVSSAARLQTLQQRLNKMKGDVACLVAQHHKGGRILSALTEFPTPECSKMMMLGMTGDGECIGKIRIPSDTGVTYRVIVDQDSLQAIHKFFIK